MAINHRSLHQFNGKFFFVAAMNTIYMHDVIIGKSLSLAGNRTTYACVIQISEENITYYDKILQTKLYSQSPVKYRKLAA
ncbi:hypothetical protein [Bacillus sp. FJAT-27225]|uniref:hypothetical protein n=1 Tax=Bacillus sp. FJAT-27225 TaxID=1743144 RepID=UPI00158695A8|nr:hypothetical protein [Bacillus sp. FJAT-27225]